MPNMGTKAMTHDREMMAREVRQLRFPECEVHNLSEGDFAVADFILTREAALREQCNRALEQLDKIDYLCTGADIPEQRIISRHSEPDLDSVPVVERVEELRAKLAAAEARCLEADRATNDWQQVARQAEAGCHRLQRIIDQTPTMDMMQKLDHLRGLLQRAYTELNGDEVDKVREVLLV